MAKLPDKGITLRAIFALGVVNELSAQVQGEEGGPGLNNNTRRVAPDGGDGAALVLPKPDSSAKDHITKPRKRAD
jgi:hypothetical protein